MCRYLRTYAGVLGHRRSRAPSCEVLPKGSCKETWTKSLKVTCLYAFPEAVRANVHKRMVLAPFWCRNAVTPQRPRAHTPCWRLTIWGKLVVEKSMNSGTKEQVAQSVAKVLQSAATGLRKRSEIAPNSQNIDEKASP